MATEVRTLDQDLGVPSGAGTITGAGSATTPWGTSATAGYLTLTTPSTNASPIYYGAAGVTSSNGLPIWPGTSRQIRLANPALSAVYVSSGDSAGWAVER